MELVNPDKNPLFGHARAELFIAYRDGRPVGRIAAHIDELALDAPPWCTVGVRGDGLGARIIPTAGASVGNYFTGGGLAAHAEVGWNLPDTVGAISLRNGIDPIGLIAATRSHGNSADHAIIVLIMLGLLESRKANATLVAG